MQSKEKLYDASTETPQKRGVNHIVFPKSFNLVWVIESDEKS